MELGSQAQQIKRGRSKQGVRAKQGTWSFTAMASIYLKQGVRAKLTHQGSAGALISYYVGSMNMLIPPIPYKPDFFNPCSKLCAFALIPGQV